jgi:uncharacterized phage infection (PIP) family protein YhgE
MVLRRFLGVLMLLIGLAGLVLCVLGAIYVPQFVGGVTEVVTDNLDLASKSLGTVSDTLQLAHTSLEAVQDGLQTLERASLDLSRAITLTQPLLDELTQLTSHDVPDSLEAVQAAVPKMAHAADVVESALIRLSNLRLEQSILGVPLRLDLGFQYDPETSLADSIRGLSAGLEGVIPRLRGLDTYLETSTGSLDVIAADLEAASENVRAINGQLSNLGPLLDSYVGTTEQVQGLIDTTASTVASQLDRIKLVLWVALGWFALLQLIPLYLAWELLTQEPVESD